MKDNWKYLKTHAHIFGIWIFRVAPNFLKPSPDIFHVFNNLYSLKYFYYCEENPVDIEVDNSRHLNYYPSTKTSAPSLLVCSNLWSELFYIILYTKKNENKHFMIRLLANFSTQFTLEFTFSIKDNLILYLNSLNIQKSSCSYMEAVSIVLIIINIWLWNIIHDNRYQSSANLIWTTF